MDANHFLWSNSFISVYVLTYLISIATRTCMCACVCVRVCMCVFTKAMINTRRIHVFSYFNYTDGFVCPRHNLLKGRYSYNLTVGARDKLI